MPGASTDVPYRVGMDYGTGFDLLDGSIDGLTVLPGLVTTPTNAPGQTVIYAVDIVQSFEELYKSIGIDVSVSGHFALFQGSAKFDYANSTSFNSQSTFFTARCVVTNPFTQCLNAQLIPDGNGFNLLTKGRTKDFTKAYGDGFVRGLQTGGEFFAVISVTSSTREEQESVAAAIQVSYGSIFASVDGKASIDDQTKARVSKSRVLISTYQRGGDGDSQSITTDIESVMNRIKMFPAVARAQPVPYSAQIARYYTITLPDGPNPADTEARREALQRYAELLLSYQTMQHDIDFVQSNPDLYVNPPPTAVSNAWATFVSNQINAVRTQASACYNDFTACKDMAFITPNDWSLPPRKATNSVDVLAAAGSWPDHVFKQSVAIGMPEDFQVTTCLATQFSTAHIAGYFGVGLVLFADSLNRGVWFLKGVGDTGPSLDCYAITQVLGNVIRVGSGGVPWPDDKAWLRMTRKGPQILDLSYSLNGQDWKSLARFVDLPALGFPADTPMRLVFAAYSTESVPVSGTFTETSIAAV